MDDEILSTDFQPRPYQIFLYEKAVEQNSIIYLPTGSGKTFIAVLLTKKLSHDLYRPYNVDGKRTIFLVNTVALVQQQCAFMRRHTGLVCKGYEGNMKVDFWSMEVWQKEFLENQVLVMTSQIFLNILESQFIQINKINLLIFDECHRAVKGHPMKKIMEFIQFSKDYEHPKILGMSASLLNKNVITAKICTTLRELEATFQSTIVTIGSKSLIKHYATNPIESLIYYDDDIQKSSTLEKISDIIKRTVNVLNNIHCVSKFSNLNSSVEFQPTSITVKLSRIFNDIKEMVDDMGLYGGKLGMLVHLMQLHCIKRYYMDQEYINLVDYAITQLIKIQKLGNDELRDSLENIFNFSSPKILQLFKVLKDFNKKENNARFCCIIFVQRRVEAQVIYIFLTKLISYDESFNFLKPEFIVGNNADPYKTARETLMTSKKCKEVLEQFRQGSINCLVATDVVDEGIDIPSCSLIIRYYPPQDFRAYVQSKGRARNAYSNFITLCPKNGNFQQRYNTYHQIEKTLDMALYGRINDQLQQYTEDIDETLSNKPFIYEMENGTAIKISETSAISRINHYCSLLCKSKFFTLAPTWKLKKIFENGQLLFKVELSLPPLSPLLETISSDVCQSVAAAKRSAALKACVALLKIGELNENLLPKSVKDTFDDNAELFPFMKKESKTSSSIPGTKLRKRRHQRIHPESLYAAYPKETEPAYLHVIVMKPNYAQPAEYDNRHLVFYNLMADENTYGILSRKPMPHIPSFPIFMKIGDMQVRVRVNNQKIILSKEEINIIRTFHILIFNNILSVIKDFVVFDTQSIENSFLIVPLDPHLTINWDILKRYVNIIELPVEDLVNLKESEYDLTLVKPNYRTSDVYIVTKVCEYLKADSKFPTFDYDSYVHYFREKHNLNIKKQSQPMLEVKPISKHINFIKPSNITSGLSSRKRRKNNQDFEEHLVPELCERIDFPALYWLKATTLPSILHRISQFLTAEDLRLKIEEEVFDRPSNTDILLWESLRLNDKIKKTVQSDPFDSTLEDTLMGDADISEIDNLDYQDTRIDVDIFNDEKLYSWSKDEEPPDLVRNVEKIQLIDIEYYFQFILNVTEKDNMIVKNQDTAKISYESVIKVDIPSLEILEKTSKSGPSPIDIMQSLTTTSCNDCFSLEREETLGDSFLKFAVSLFLHQRFPTYTEGQLTYIKGILVGNLNLFYCALEKNIPGRMNVEEFSPLSNFITPSFLVNDKLRTLLIELEVSATILYELQIPKDERFNGSISTKTTAILQDKVLSWAEQSESDVTHTGMEPFLGIQVISDKSVSDCVEALIGTYLLHLGITGGLKILKWLSILPQNLDINELLTGAVSNSQLNPGNVNDLMPWADVIEDTIGYKFHNRAYLLNAFTHPSFAANRLTSSYERLEFLGDAILDFLITVYIYEACDNLNPGELTDLRSALVNNITFSCLAVRHGLHTALCMQVPDLFVTIDKFVKFQENRNHAIDDELLWILVEEEDCNMAEHVDVPKVLGDIFESLIGAIFLDSGKNLDKVWKIIYSLMKKEIDLFSKNVPKQPIRVIYETEGANPVFSESTKLENSNTVMVNLSIYSDGKKKLFHGFGTTKKLAKCAAAKQALKYLRCK